MSHWLSGIPFCEGGEEVNGKARRTPGKKPCGNAWGSITDVDQASVPVNAGDLSCSEL